MAARWLPDARPGDYNQALMELGRTVCKPRVPLCAVCPLTAHCRAYAAGTQAARPVKARKAPIPHYDVTAGLIWNDNSRLLIAQRPLDGLLGGLWEFPGGKREPGETLEDCLRRELREELVIEVEVRELFTVVRHGFTHFKITLHAFTCRYVSGPPQAVGVRDWAWAALDELDVYTFGRADRAVIAELRARPHMLL
jgi:A/G-specific adenine glycosylase